MRYFWAMLAVGCILAGCQENVIDQRMKIVRTVPRSGRKVVMPNGASVDIPSASIEGEFVLSITTTGPEGDANTKGNIRLAGPIYHLEPRSMMLVAPVKVALPFNDRLLRKAGSIDAHLLKIAVVGKGRWRSVDAQEIDEVGGYVYAQLDQLGPIALVAPLDDLGVRMAHGDRWEPVLDLVEQERFEDAVAGLQRWTGDQGKDARQTSDVRQVWLNVLAYLADDAYQSDELRARALYLYAQLWRSLGDLQAALENYRQVTELYDGTKASVQACLQWALYEEERVQYELKKDNPNFRLWRAYLDKAYAVLDALAPDSVLIHPMLESMITARTARAKWFEQKRLYEDAVIEYQKITAELERNSGILPQERFWRKDAEKHMARLVVQQKQSSDLIKWLDEVIAGNQHFPGIWDRPDEVRSAYLNKCALLEARGEYQRALDEYQPMRDFFVSYGAYCFSRPVPDLEAAWRMAQIYRGHLHSPQRAYDLYLQIIEEYAMYTLSGRREGFGLQGFKEIAQLKGVMSDSVRAFVKLMNEGCYEEAGRTKLSGRWQSFALFALGARLADGPGYNYAQGEAARRAFIQVMNSSRSSTMLDDAQFYIGVATEKMRRPVWALGGYRLAAQGFPYSNSFVPGAQRTVEMAEASGDFELAAEFLERLVKYYERKFGEDRCPYGRCTDYYLRLARAYGALGRLEEEGIYAEKYERASKNSYTSWHVTEGE